MIGRTKPEVRLLGLVLILLSACGGPPTPTFESTCPSWSEYACAIDARCQGFDEAECRADLDAACASVDAAEDAICGTESAGRLDVDAMAACAEALRTETGCPFPVQPECASDLLCVGG